MFLTTNPSSLPSTPSPPPPLPDGVPPQTQTRHFHGVISCHRWIKPGRCTRKTPRGLSLSPSITWRRGEGGGGERLTSGFDTCVCRPKMESWLSPGSTTARGARALSPGGGGGSHRRDVNITSHPQYLMHPLTRPKRACQHVNPPSWVSGEQPGLYRRHPPPRAVTC